MESMVMVYLTLIQSTWTAGVTSELMAEKFENKFAISAICKKFKKNKSKNFSEIENSRFVYEIVQINNKREKVQQRNRAHAQH